MKAMILNNVMPGATVSTDEFGSYRRLHDLGFNHMIVRHNAGQFATHKGAGDQWDQGLLGVIKRGINGTHIHVSAKHLLRYLGKFEYPYNMRHLPHLMLDRLMVSFLR
jgi:transposase-like protein